MNNNLSSKNRLVARPGASIAILLGIFFFFMCIFSLLSSIIAPHIQNPTTSIRLLTLFQGIFLFIVPALATALLSTKLPATLLAIDQKPRLLPSLTIILTIVIAIPAMNYIIEWNNNIQFPESMNDLYRAIREMEDTAAQATNLMMGSDSIGSLIVSLLIVAVMAGLSEELFFRGALQRILTSTRINRQAAVCIAAFIFSFMHFQFFGFIPRLLLGMFFGYILLWSNNLWYCIIAHATNNALAVTAMWLDKRSLLPINIDSIGQSGNTDLPKISIIIKSIILTTI